MRKRVLPTLAVPSLACCLLFCGLWLRSYWVWDSFDLPYGRYAVGAFSLNGQLGLLRSTVKRQTTGWFSRPAPYPPRVADHWTFRIDQTREQVGSVSHTTTYSTTPLWFPAFLTAIPPALWLRRRRKQQGGTGFPLEVTPDA